MKYMTCVFALSFLMNLCSGVSLAVSSVFDFGIATRGPLELSGSFLLDGMTISTESNVYIESINDDNALSIIGDCQIGGDVKIVNPDAYVTLLGGAASIGGETGQDAINNHVEIGTPENTFPIPGTSHFEQYATGIIIDSTTNLSTLTTLNNVRIAAGTNPTFSVDIQINGVLFIEQPNVVNFNGNVDITGIVVGNGNYTDNSGANQITFLGSISSRSVTELAESFGTLRDETGTFIIAPGFVVSIGGSFDTLNGCIAANGVELFGYAGGIIGGMILNYSDEPMVISSSNNLFFNRAGGTDLPAGFVWSYTCNPHLPMDFNEDCKIDLLDFVVFMEHWLECNREPIEACYQ